MPAATPPAIIARLNREVNEILAPPKEETRWSRKAWSRNPARREALTERIRADIEKWRGVVAKAGIRAE